jgi:hypothetical protein
MEPFPPLVEKSLVTRVVVIFFLCVWLPAGAQNYVHSGPIGEQEIVTCTESDQGKGALRCMIGKRIMILPKRKELQSYGYQMIRPAERSGLRGIEYEEGSGKTGAVASVVTDEPGHKAVRVKMDSGVILDLHSYSYGGPSFDDVVFLDDIDSARNLYLGKYLWLNDTTLSTLADGDRTLTFSIPRFSRVRVTEIVAGWDSDEPVRFILETPAGSVGYVDVRMSESNVSNTISPKNRFDRKFFTRSPRESHKWPAKIWSAIERGAVLLGMNEEQVLMSLGAPDNVNATRVAGTAHEQWVYGSYRFVYFESGLVTAVQD